MGLSRESEIIDPARGGNFDAFSGRCKGAAGVAGNSTYFRLGLEGVVCIYFMRF